METDKLRYSNIEIVEPTEGKNLTLEKINESYFKEILNTMSHES